MRSCRKPLGATQLVDLLARNPGHTAILAILDATVYAAAISVQDNDAAAADGRTPPSTHGVRIGLFANGIWVSRKPGANVRVALLIANG
jgi:hypothetical protein